MLRKLPSRRFLILIVFGLSALLFGNSLYIVAKSQLAQVLISQAWNQTQQHAVETGQLASKKPWGWADTHPVARLQVPTQLVDMIVLQGVSGEALSFGPGFVAESSQIGEGGDSVIAGHRDTHFAFLKHLKTGDALNIETLSGETIQYEVDSLEVIDSDVVDLNIEPNFHRIRLVTCYPFGSVTSGSLRYVVTAVAKEKADA
jgi:sortase A